MAPRLPNRDDAQRRARSRTVLIFAGIFDLVLAGLVLGWGTKVLQIEHQMAWLIAAVLAAGGVVILFIATLAFGRRGTGAPLDPGEDKDDRGPIVRR
ncbi:MAG: hypothetical protein KIT16_02735 [Rhodospirillaceae bacterium]|nr:hypothetical protein [Rhodospirillaceae bacterium]